MASKRRLRRQKCLGKRKWDTQEAVLAHIKYLNRTKKLEQLTVYHCNYCGTWHYGHTPAYVQKEIQDRRRKQISEGD